MKYLRTLMLSSFFLITLLGLSCKKNDTTTVNMGYHYFPVNVGHWVSYLVDSISYNDFTHTIDTSQFQIKEKIESEYVDSLGYLTQRLERYKRANDTSSWYLKDVWTLSRNESRAEKTEENLKIVKLTFPVNKGNEWNGNAFNYLAAETYKCTDAHIPQTLNGLNFDSCATVEVQLNQSLIEEKKSSEIYATNVGMIYKEYVNLSKLPTGEIKSGIRYSYKIIAFGN